MNAGTTRKSLVTLAMLAVLTAITGVAFVAVHFTQWDDLSLLLGACLVVLVVISLWVLLEALEQWVERAEGGDRP